MNLTTLPKVELHCHLDGILDREMVRDIRQDDPAFPIDPIQFERAYPVESFEDFFRWWNFINPIEGNLDYFYPILARYIKRLKAENVVYSEIMVAGGELPKDHQMAIDKLSAFRNWVDKQEDESFQLEFLIAVGRNKPPELFDTVADRVLALYNAGLIVGVALAGPEKGNPVKPLHKSFEKFHEAGLKIEIHAGEWCGPESVWDALEYGFPDRLGHGVTIFQDQKLLDLIRERSIHIEMCPTSNLKTGSVSDIKVHPVRQAMELGLNFSINTDDPGPFNNSMTSEYETLANTFGFKEKEFQTIFRNSLDSRFNHKDTKGKKKR